MATERRRLPVDARLDDVVRELNRSIDITRGSTGGSIKLMGYDGEEREIRGGDSISSGNYALDIQAASGNHLQIEHSTGAPLLVAVDDSGVTLSQAHVTGGLTVDGNTQLGDAPGDTVTIAGPTTVGGALGVSGAAHFTSTVEVDGALTVQYADGTDALTVSETGVVIQTEASRPLSVLFPDESEALSVTAAGVAFVGVPGGISTAEIANGAVTTTTSGSAGSTTSSTTFVALGSTLNFTAAGGVCYFSFACSVSQASATGLQQIIYRLDSGSDNYIHYENMTSSGVGSRGGEYVLNAGVALSGAHTIDLRYAVSAGSFTVSPIQYRVREFKK